MKIFTDGLSPKGVVIAGRWYAADWSKADSIESRLHCFFDFARERHAVYLRKSAGQPKPWTNDPIIANHRFCNIYRELDTVSVWIKENVIDVYEDDPNLWFMLAACRVINWPDSLAEMMDARGGFGIRGRYDPGVAFKTLMDRRHRKLKTITGAYIVNSVTKKTDPELWQGNKLAVISYRTLGELWKARDEIGECFKSTMQQSVDTLKRYSGFGPFISYQVTVDLSYSKKWLAGASDYNTFNSAGPGTTKGLSIVFHGGKGNKMADEEKTRLLSFQLKASQNPSYWPVSNKNMRKGVAPLSMSNISNMNCEASKHWSVFTGAGRMRSSYPGGLFDNSTQSSLF